LFEHHCQFRLDCLLDDPPRPLLDQIVQAGGPPRFALLLLFDYCSYPAYVSPWWWSSIVEVLP
jgi:hypothetical protein